MRGCWIDTKPATPDPDGSRPIDAAAAAQKAAISKGVRDRHGIAEISCLPQSALVADVLVLAVAGLHLRRFSWWESDLHPGNGGGRRVPDGQRVNASPGDQSHEPFRCVDLSVLGFWPAEDRFVRSAWVFFQLLSWVAIRSRIG